jgi:hypothetical protein
MGKHQGGGMIVSHHHHIHVRDPAVCHVATPRQPPPAHCDPASTKLQAHLDGKWIPPLGLVVGGSLTNANVRESNSLGPKLTSSSSGYDAGGEVGRMRNDYDDQSRAAIYFHHSILCQTHTSCVNLTHPVLKRTHSI